ncbi:hypothetical protein LSUE1_G001896 [Lachnellula suecica]|uniref:Uncharacterized protein n=1 Tax=Lachnellula suecica TaxID=602035 RepID=A0A8T9CCK2_9HELO|nr:hypothetical protein LSUE1_G001896 [Lachnellula suecica]
MPGTKFYGSQVGGKSVTPHSYTGSPLELLRHDIFSALGFYDLLFNIVFPINPCGSGEFCELYPSFANLWAMFLHLVLILMQLPFILSVPFWLLFPGWVVLLGILGFGVVNKAVCFLLNGSRLRFRSNPKYAGLKKEHEHEQWIFLNGVAVGKHWMQNNIDRLALTFGRPVLGVHNKTTGIIFDVLQCLVQRNFNYATMDIRDCYKIVKATLYDVKLTKVIFIMHSQGGIEGGMILDWLLQEVPQDLLAKLEIYTFGNAANHFNNPHLHMLSQNAALKNPRTATLTKTKTHISSHPDLPANGNGNGNGEVQQAGTVRDRETEHTSTPQGKTIHHIEHYAHTHDPVSRWGVLHFITSPASSSTAPRFMGRVFERQGVGHQFCLHYLDSMFPLRRCESGVGVGGSGFDGAHDECDFMDEDVEWWGRAGLESMESSSLSASGSFSGEASEVGLMDMSPVSTSSTLNALKGGFENGRGFTDRGRRGRSLKLGS